MQIGNAGAAPTLVVPAQPVNAAVSTPFSYQVVSTGSGVTFGASGLPDGLSIDPGTGIISGAPTVAGSSSVTLTATNAYGQATATLSLQVKSSSDLPVVTLTADTPSASVGGGQPGVFTLSLSAAQATDTVVSFTVKGTAVNGSDYVLLKTTKKIKAGKTSKPIKITPQGDLGGAAKKTVVLTLQPGDGYTVGTTGKVKVKILSGQ